MLKFAVIGYPVKHSKSPAMQLAGFQALGIEATYEVRVDKPDALLNKLRGVPGVYDATLVSYQGESV